MTNPERKQLVDEWHNGNENMAAFCRSKNLNYQTFRLWVKRFEDEALPSITKPSLVKLEIPAMPGPLETGNSSIEIHIGQFKVVIPIGSFNMENLEGIMKILRKLSV